MPTPHGLRSAATAILFLLAAGERSRWHRLRSDETWFHQGGAPLRIHEICRDGSLRQTRLGMDIQAGESPQHVVPAGHWFCAEPLAAEGWSLVGCCVAPGFSFEDFELATLSQLEQHRRILEADCPHWRTFCRPAAGPQDQA